MAIDLRKGFASVGWDVKTNAPDPSCTAPPPHEKVMGFLDKAAIKFAPGRPASAAPPAGTTAEVKKDAPKKLKVEVANETAPAGGNDDDAGVQFGAPDPGAAAPAAQEARQAQDARAVKLAPAGTPTPAVNRVSAPRSRAC